MTRIVSTVLLLLFGAAGFLVGQGTVGSVKEVKELPPAPPTFVHDGAGLFDRYPERLQTITTRLQEFQAQQNLPFYIAVYGGIIDSYILRRGRLLHDKWVGPGQDGIVLIYDIDTNDYEVVLPSSGQADSEQEDEFLSRLVDYKMIPILADLKVALAGEKDRVEFVDRSSLHLTERMGVLLTETTEEKNSRSTTYLLVGMLGGALLLGAIVFVFYRRFRRVEKKAREQFYFPDIRVGTRLGAPFGGGRSSVVTYQGSEGPR